MNILIMNILNMNIEHSNHEHSEHEHSEHEHPGNILGHTGQTFSIQWVFGSKHIQASGKKTSDYFNALVYSSRPNMNLKRPFSTCILYVWEVLTHFYSFLKKWVTPSWTLGYTVSFWMLCLEVVSTFNKYSTWVYPRPRCWLLRWSEGDPGSSLYYLMKT